jgi:hypothetical protein
MNATIPEPEISATKVHGSHERTTFLERWFGRYMIAGESEVFSWMGHLAESYNNSQGAYWELYKLSNGGHFMAPRIGKVQISSPNEFEGEFSEEAAGIIACLYALSHLSCKVHESGGNTDALAEQFVALREYAIQHSEGQAILAAID